MKIKIGKKQILTLSIFFVISLIFLIFGITNYELAFSEASVDMEYSRTEIQQICTDFIEFQGFNPDSEYKKTVIFSSDSIAKTFVDKEFGIEKLEQLTEQGYNIWHWTCRRFKPLQKEEFILNFSPSGKIKMFNHIIEEDAPGADPTRDRALEIAEDFLVNTVKLDPEKIILKEEKKVKQPNRTDYEFEWELRNFELKDAVYRYQVTIKGESVGYYREYLKVPEAWQRNYRKLRSNNNFYQSIANIMFIILFLMIIINFVIQLIKKNIKFKLALKFGLVMLILQILSHFNTYPFYLSGYDVNSSFSAFIIQFIFGGLAQGLVQGFMIFLVVASGETVYRSFFKDKNKISVLFSRKGFTQSEVFTSSLWGYFLAMFHLGFVIIFYIVSSKFGAWAPASTQYTDMVNTVIPWIFPLTIGVMAAVSEEFIFRVFAIPVFKKITGSTVLAVIIPAFLWGFLHSNYPQQPGFIRGVEVGLIGIAAGLILIRYGILATLIWHYAIDSLLVGMFLFASGNTYFIVSGVIVVGVVFIPVVVSIVKYFKNKGFIKDPNLINSSDIPEPESKEEKKRIPHPNIEYKPLKITGVAVLVILILISGIWMFISKSISPVKLFTKPTTAKHQTIRIAEEFLKDKGIETKEYRSASALYNANVFWQPIQRNVDFLRENMGVDQVEKYFSKYLQPQYFYAVRFFKPGEKEAYYIYIKLNGEVYNYSHTLAETAPGAELNRVKAMELAQKFLETNYPGMYDPERFEFLDSARNKRENRIDYRFTWKNKDGLVNEAYPRLNVKVQGDEVLFSGPNLKLPEKWKLERNKQTWVDTAGSIIMIFCIGIVIGLMLMVFFMNLKYKMNNWRPVIQMSIGLGVLFFIRKLILLPNILVGYDTSGSLNQYIVRIVAGDFVSSIGIFLVSLFVISLTQQVLFMKTGIWNPIPYSRKGLKKFIRDTLLKGITAGIVLGAVWKFYQVISLNLNIKNIPVPVARPAFLEYSNPILPVIITGIIVIILGSSLGYILNYILKRHLKPGLWFVYLLITGVMLAGNISRFSFPAMLYLVWLVFAMITVLVLTIIRILKENYFAYPVAGLVMFIGHTTLMTGYDIPGFKSGFWIIAGILIAALVLLFLRSVNLIKLTENLNEEVE